RSTLALRSCLSSQPACCRMAQPVFSARNEMASAFQHAPSKPTPDQAAWPIARTILTYAANNTDLLTITNAFGVQVSSNSFNAYHQVLTNYDALGELTVYTYNGNAQLTSVARPTGLVTTNVYFSSGAGSNQLSTSIDYAVVGGSTVNYRTNSFTWANDLLL